MAKGVWHLCVKIERTREHIYIQYPYRMPPLKKIYVTRPHFGIDVFRQVDKSPQQSRTPGPPEHDFDRMIFEKKCPKIARPPGFLSEVILGRVLPLWGWGLTPPTRRDAPIASAELIA